MMKKIRFIGRDVHAQSIALALAENGGGEARTYGTIPNKPHVWGGFSGGRILKARTRKIVNRVPALR